MKQGQGFLTVACNNKETDYLSLAYRLAESLKDTDQSAKISVIVNNLEEIEDKHQKIFDKIILYNNETKFSAETQVWRSSPYKQTIKIEADMIVPVDISYWWSILDQKDVVLTNHVMTYWGDVITDRSQRKLFDDNNLPNIYSGIYYFRHSADSKLFFDIVSSIYKNWDWFRDQLLKNCRYKEPVTDEVFAIAAKIYGVHRCTITNSIPTFVHMKNQLQRIPTDDHWFNYVYFEKSQMAIGNFKQIWPIHYQDKAFDD
jgi:hypothetical protein